MTRAPAGLAGTQTFERACALLHAIAAAGEEGAAVRCNCCTPRANQMRGRAVMAPAATSRALVPGAPPRWPRPAAASQARPASASGASRAVSEKRPATASIRSRLRSRP